MWNALSVDEQYAVIVHLNSFETPFEQLLFDRFIGYDLENQEPVRIFANRSFDGSIPSDRKEFYDVCSEAEYIHDLGNEYEPRFVNLSIRLPDKSSRSFGSSYRLSGFDNKMVTVYKNWNPN